VALMSDLQPVDVHQERIAALLAATTSETVPVADAAAAGRVLAESVIALAPLPDFDNSAMDGYAVRAVDIATASPDRPVTLPVAADIPAGAAVGRLAPGTAHRIMTGAPVPVGADTVVEVEATDGGTSTVSIRSAREHGQFVRRAGDDLAPGATGLAPGSVLGPAQLGLLAALGVDEVVVRRRPRVLVCSTGSELAEHPAPGSGQIRDANGAMLAAAVREAGGDPIRQLWVADDVPTFLATLDAELADVDLLLTSGGVSAGAYEVVKESLAPRGVEFLKVAMQPGMPQGAGRYADVPVVCLPGNPVSALTSFEVFVRPALRAALGHPRPTRPVLRARLASAATSPRGKRQFRRGRLDLDAGTVELCGPPGSGFLGWFARADCLIDIPADAAEVAAGDEVDVWDLATS
jgi:molybdopterin molybdotransferase